MGDPNLPVGKRMQEFVAKLLAMLPSFLNPKQREGLPRAYTPKSLANVLVRQFEGAFLIVPTAVFEAGGEATLLLRETAEVLQNEGGFGIRVKFLTLFADVIEQQSAESLLVLSNFVHENPVLQATFRDGKKDEFSFLALSAIRDFSSSLKSKRTPGRGSEMKPGIGLARGAPQGRVDRVVKESPQIEPVTPVDAERKNEGEETSAKLLMETREAEKGMNPESADGLPPWSAPRSNLEEASEAAESHTGTTRGREHGVPEAEMAEGMLSKASFPIAESDTAGKTPTVAEKISSSEGIVFADGATETTRPSSPGADLSAEREPEDDEATPNGAINMPRTETGPAIAVESSIAVLGATRGAEPIAVELASSSDVSGVPPIGDAAGDRISPTVIVPIEDADAAEIPIQTGSMKPGNVFQSTRPKIDGSSAADQPPGVDQAGMDQPVDAAGRISEEVDAGETRPGEWKILWNAIFKLNVQTPPQKRAESIAKALEKTPHLTFLRQPLEELAWGYTRREPTTLKGDPKCSADRQLEDKEGLGKEENAEHMANNESNGARRKGGRGSKSRRKHKDKSGRRR